MSRFFKFVSLLGVMLIGLSALVGAGTSVYAIENEAPIVTSINKEDYENVQNYGEIIAALQITEDSFLSAYRIDDKSVGSTVGIINFYDSSSDTYYNLYIDQERKIDYITTQKKILMELLLCLYINGTEEISIQDLLKQLILKEILLKIIEQKERQLIKLL